MCVHVPQLHHSGKGSGPYCAIFLSSYAADKSTDPNISSAAGGQTIEEEEEKPVSIRMQ